ncbi:saccharopine dehydrogenase NADP-binding domain-containing protein [Myxococcota bacterium]|nr:saccharopine dehydrogenase NADP-binding domain-containing protein [Myxococcota bacterium]
MTKAIVLGAGMVGSVMADDLAREPGWTVAVADVGEAALARAVARAERSGGRLQAVRADLSDEEAVGRLVAPYDVVLGALPSTFGYRALRAVIGAGKPCCDISFFPEDALDLDALAREMGVTAVVDCGVAPGMSHLLAGYGASLLDRCDRIEILVGGLPRERRWPFEYKAGFSPYDVIEEYVRPSRIVEDGRVVVREALSEPELVDLPGIGTLESFNTDGLRSLVRTMTVPNMKEKTLRYPGHIELMRVFRETGLFSHEPVAVGPEGVRVRPIDVISALMFPKWTYGPGEEDLTVMRVTVDGEQGGAPTRLSWDLLDHYDRATSATSMSRTTGFPCAIVARMLARGEVPGPGVLPPERLAGVPGLVDRVLAEHEARGVRYATRREALPA